MRLSKWSLLAVMLATTCALAQGTDVTGESVENYREWGWDALVMGNGLITVATMPSIGARIMQYDLGDHSSIFVNEDEVGKLYEPRSNSPWHNYGGYKVWPAPQDRWGWPPPPILDFGKYEGVIDQTSTDSVSVSVSSPVERWKTPNLRFKRRTTIYRGTSRVKVEQTIINEGESVDSWSVWDVTQQIVHHQGERDFDNFWVYFPINPDSRYGSRGVRVSAESDAWKGEVAAGIFGVQFLPENKKIFADSHQGWICYVDEQEGRAYAKTFDLFPGESYPDQGAHVEVWINGDPLYLEVEVVSPVVELAPNGGSYTFIEDWWAAKVNGPILAVNRVGAMAQKLRLDGGKATATAGVFHEGTAQLVFVGGDGSMLGQGGARAVTPLRTFVLDEEVVVPEGTMSAEIRVMSEAGDMIGVLDRVEGLVPTAVTGEQKALPQRFELRQSYPNPFNASVVIDYRVPEGIAGEVELAVFNVAGEKIRTLVRRAHGGGEYRVTWDGKDGGGKEGASGIYLYRLKTADWMQVKRMVLLR